MKNNKRVFRNIILIFIFFIIFSFIIFLSIPSKIILPENSELSVRICPFKIGTHIVTSTSTDEARPVVKRNKGTLEISAAQAGAYSYDVKLFDKLLLKRVNVSVIPKNYVIPSGEAVGIKMFTDGLLVVNVSSVKAQGGGVARPAHNAGIRENDRIMAVDGIKMETNEEFSDYINSVGGEVEVTVMRGEEQFITKIIPVKSAEEDIYKVGMWVRDSTAGIGTLTFYRPDKGVFATLGHPICDADTEEIMKISDGTVLKSKIVGIKKGESGVPGELTGYFEDVSIGKICVNNDFGVYGSLNETGFNENLLTEVGTRFQIKEGPAQIMCDVDGQGVKKYDINICKVSKEPICDNKGIILEVTDNELLSKTGGIVCGMSGAPIIQNNLLIGAVTHVFVNNPKKGYGVFIESMMEETEKIK